MHGPATPRARRVVTTGTMAYAVAEGAAEGPGPGSGPGSDRPTVQGMLAEHLGEDAWQLPAASGSWPSFEHVNVQTAVELFVAQEGEHRLLGIVGFRHRSFGIVDLCQPQGEHGLRIGGVATVEMASGPGGEVRACLQCGLYLLTRGDIRFAILVRGSDQRGPQPDVTVEIVSNDPVEARAAVSEIGRLAIAHSVYRGHAVGFKDSPQHMRTETLLTFLPRTRLEREDLVLPEGLLEGVEQQVYGVARHRALLRAHGLHLKRGVLLYGAPGVGKTHTVRYLMGLLPDTTVIVVTGSALRFITEACSLARDLQPALLVIEDVDLIAQERGRFAASPLLFELLNQMDGLGEDADVAFVLTTNRPEVLEPALASRPGRIDHAVELPLPDAAGRRQLMEIYKGSLELELNEPDEVLARTEGVTASFLKELLRRAALIAADEAADEGAAERSSLRVTDAHLRAALDLLDDDRNRLTRRLLGKGHADATAEDDASDYA